MINKISFLLILLFFSSSIKAQSIIEPGIGNDILKIGKNINDIIKQIGKPIHTSSRFKAIMESRKTENMTYINQRLEFNIDFDKVYYFGPKGKIRAYTLNNLIVALYFDIRSEKLKMLKKKRSILIDGNLDSIKSFMGDKTLMEQIYSKEDGIAQHIYFKKGISFISKSSNSYFGITIFKTTTNYSNMLEKMRSRISNNTFAKQVAKKSNYSLSSGIYASFYNYETANEKFKPGYNIIDSNKKTGSYWTGTTINNVGIEHFKYEILEDFLILNYDISSWKYEKGNKFIEKKPYQQYWLIINSDNDTLTLQYYKQIVNGEEEIINSSNKYVLKRIGNRF